MRYAFLDRAIDVIIGHPLVAIAAAFAAGLFSWFVTRTGDQV